MNRLNYNHLFYFYRVATLGSVSEASNQLNLAQPTVSAQIKTLEGEVGEKLFKREGRYLKLTESGELVFRYCKKIFELADELAEAIEGRLPEAREILRIGISDVVPKHLAYRIIAPLYSMETPPRLHCIEEHAESLLAKLAIHEIDMVLADCPLPPSVNIVAYSHLLGSSGLSFLAAKRLIGKTPGKFPQCLSDFPLLLPTGHAAVRHEIDHWLKSNMISPPTISEFQDSALIKIFGREGRGVFLVPSVIEQEISRELGVRVLGRIDRAISQFYLISTERRLKRSATSTIWESAHKHLFR